MLRHPFHEIVTAPSNGNCSNSATTVADGNLLASVPIGRRNFFASVAAGAAAVAALFVGQSAYGRGRRTANRTRSLSDATTLAIGEEGGQTPSPSPPPSPPPPPPPGPPTYTTLMLGEEGGHFGDGPINPPFTTFIIGEEG